MLYIAKLGKAYESSEIESISYIRCEQTFLLKQVTTYN